MTVSMGSLHMAVVAAITAGGVMLAQAGFGGAPFDAGLKAGAGDKVRVPADGRAASISAGAEASAEADAGLDTSSDCLADCPAPCATGCAPKASLSAEGAGRTEGAFTAAVAPEHSCGCPDDGQALEAEGETEAELGAEATIDAGDTFAAALTGDADGSAIFGTD